jgi:hypothetical protein
MRYRQSLGAAVDSFKNSGLDEVESPAAESGKDGGPSAHISPASGPASDSATVRRHGSFRRHTDVSPFGSGPLITIYEIEVVSLFYLTIKPFEMKKTYLISHLFQTVYDNILKNTLIFH